MDRVVRKRTLGWLCFAAALALSGCPGLDDGDQRPDPTTVLVNIQDTYFLPETVVVTRGRNVRWTNRGVAQHRVVADTAAWQSNLLPNNWWFEVRFDSLGTFGYHCLADSTHTETGVVIVQ